MTEPPPATDPADAEARPESPPAATGPGRRRAAVWGVVAAAVAGLTYLAGHDPHDPSTVMPGCPIHRATGLDCPACGTLRATYDVLHGRWAAAGHDNVFVLACAPLLAGLLARQARAVRDDRYAPLPAPLAYGLGGAALVWMVVRNLPGWPLTPGSHG
ncbi:DUF2752 domain-containing protein [Frankia sp. AvcI1]|uniref:DUF2752 domain-containing protein n=1 Tax=Frankia sp. AvcI1 TaxID=573496 RepID=UPI0006EC1CF7|nr:DUF2752 domain-containing protein [Frankia sp. AvcI1]